MDSDTPSTSSTGGAAAAAASQRNLYDILMVSPNATKADIKRAYIALARQTHPDAKIQWDSNNRGIGDSSDVPTSSMEFAQISQAYKILSDPLERLRYDRAIRAEALSRNFESALDQWTATAGPPVLQALDKFAIPFLRRSAASAVAVVSSVILQTTSDSIQQQQQQPSQGDGNIDSSSQSTITINKYTDGNFTASSSSPSSSSSGDTLLSSSGPDFTQVIAKAIRAGQRANQAMDRLELIEKRKEIQQRVKLEKIQLMEKRQELTNIMFQRYSLIVATPNSHVSSMDACTILDRFNSLLEQPIHGNEIHTMERDPAQQQKQQQDRKGEEYDDMDNVYDEEEPWNASTFSTSTSTTSNKILTLQQQQQQTRHYPFSFLDAMLHKRSIEDHIEQLKLAEDEFDDKNQQLKQLQDTLQQKIIQVQRAQQSVELAIQAEDAARQALEEAIVQVYTTKARLAHVTKAVSTSDEAYRRMVGEVDKVAYTLERKQERVRMELQRKQEEVFQVQSKQQQGSNEYFDLGFSSSAFSIQQNEENDIAVVEQIQQNQFLIQQLEQRERDIQADIEQLVLKISRMNSRAQKLQEKSSEL